MGFCDPCPGEAKQLKVEYSYLGHQYQVYFCCSLLQTSKREIMPVWVLWNLALWISFWSGAPSCSQDIGAFIFVGCLGGCGLCTHQNLLNQVMYPACPLTCLHIVVRRLWLETTMSCGYRRRHIGYNVLLRRSLIKWINYPSPPPFLACVLCFTELPIRVYNFSFD